jgi:hypothetical protein
VRVLFYYSAPVWSGSARVFAAAGRGLAERGYQVTFVCTSAARGVEARAAAEGCDVVTVEPDGTAFGTGWELKKLLVDRFVETVFVHTEREHLAAALAIRFAKRGGIVRRTAAGGVFVVGRGTKTAARLAATTLVFATTGEAQAAPLMPRTREQLTVDLGVDAGRYDELRPAALTSIGARGEGARVLVCVYDPGGKARAATVLRTMALLAPRHPELHLVLFGPGAGHEDIRMHAAALGIGAVVTHIESRDDDLAVLRAADLGWVVASEDSAVYAALDFMAMRVPVLVDRGTVAARYVADGISGVVLPVGDAPATAATIAEMLAHEDERSAMGNAGHGRVVRDYAEETMLDGLQRAAEAARDRTRWTST